MRYKIRSFFSKLFLVVLLAVILGIFAIISVPAVKQEPKSETQTDTASALPENGQGEVLGATTESVNKTEALRAGSETKVCAFKIFTDSLPRGDETVQDSLCNQ